MEDNIISKVVKTQSINPEASPMSVCMLGDVITDQSGKPLSIRSIVSFPKNIGGLSGFVMLGEFDSIIATPVKRGMQHEYYLPIGSQSEITAHLMRLSGITSYWSPNLPAYKDAMGEILFTVVTSKKSLYPFILIKRGYELLVFVRVNSVNINTMKLHKMPRTDASAAPEFEIVRHAAALVKHDNSISNERNNQSKSKNHENMLVKQSSI